MAVGGPASIDPIPGLLQKVDSDSVEQDVRRLVAFGTRQTGTATAEEAAEYLYERFGAVGYQASRQYQEFLFSARSSRNVLCGRRRDGKRLVLLCAHYDSTNDEPQQPCGPPPLAPGADDNASGIAAVVEVARVLQDQELGIDVMFAAFGGEELDLAGSRRCAEIARTEGWPLDLVVNLDMIAFRKTPSDQVVIEVDTAFDGGKDGSSLEFATRMRDAALAYTSLSPVFGPFFVSDHVPFAQEHFVCIGVREQSLNIARHTSLDTMDRLAIPYMTEVTRMVLATILTIGLNGEAAA